MPENTDLIKTLNKTLATASDFYINLKVAHWNVEDINFASVHAKFDEIWETTGTTVDVIAELIRQLEGQVRGTSLDITANTELQPYNSDLSSSQDNIDAILEDAKVLQTSLKTSYLAAVDVQEYVVNNSLLNEATIRFWCP
jgi:starvation-inducible DNA-binding protein